MSFDAFLSQRCTITRDQQTGLDPYNNAVVMPFAVATDVPCRKTQKQMRALDPVTNEYVFIHADLILLPPGTNVLPRDVLTVDGLYNWQALQVLTRQGATEQRHVSVMVEALNAQTQP